MIITLNTWTWKGVVLGASHWFGSLESDKRGPVEIKRRLTPLIAASIGLPYPEMYEESAGIMNERFLSEQEIIDYAKSHFKDYFPDATGLIYRDSVIEVK